MSQSTQHVCVPTFPWTWFTLDAAYVMVLLGGSLVLRAQGKGPAEWILFGVLSVAVGAFCFSGTYVAFTQFGDALTSASAVGSGGAPADC